MMLDYSNVSVIYVSQEYGDLINSGYTPECDGFGNGPLKTLEQAIEKVCQLRVTGSYRPMTVRIVDDEYYLDSTFVLNPQSVPSFFWDNDCLSGITFEGYKKRCKLVGDSACLLGRP